MARYKGKIPGWLNKAVNACMVEISNRTGVLLCHIVDTRHKRRISEPVVEAWGQLIDWIREEIVSRRSHDGRVQFAWKIEALDNDLDRAAGWYNWQTITYPQVAAVLNCDHSSVVLVVQRRDREARRQELAALQERTEAVV